MDLFEKILLGAAVLAVGIGLLVLVGSDPEPEAGGPGRDRIERRTPKSPTHRKRGEDSWPDLLDLGVPPPAAEEKDCAGHVTRADDSRVPVQRPRRDDPVEWMSDDPPGLEVVPAEQRPDMNVQVHSYVGALIARAGPMAAETGQQLIESTNAILRLTGAAVLSQLNRLDDETLGQMANDEDSAVAVNLLGWLRDTGREEQETELVRMIAERGLGAATMARLLDSGALEAGGARVAMDFMAQALSAADAIDVYTEISEDAEREYSVRMKALLLLRDKMEFADYRDEVNRILGEAGEDSVWQEGMNRLATRLKGPEDIHEGPVVVTRHDIDVRLAREYPAMIEDLALWLDYATSHSTTYVGTNTASRLDAYVKEYDRRPWTDWQQVGLVRLKTMVARLSEIEQEARPKPSNMPAAPPGT